MVEGVCEKERDLHKGTHASVLKSKSYFKAKLILCKVQRRKTKYEYTFLCPAIVPPHLSKLSIYTRLMFIQDYCPQNLQLLATTHNSFQLFDLLNK